jgi:hypothetical protein
MISGSHDMNEPITRVRSRGLLDEQDFRPLRNGPAAVPMHAATAHEERQGAGLSDAEEHDGAEKEAHDRACG